MNNLPKYVASTTLETAEWNNSTIIGKSVPQEVARLKEQHDGDLLVAGSATLVRTLIEHDLVDEYRLLLFPLVLGSGKRLFQDGSKTNLKLTETRSFSTGVVLLIYQQEKHA